MTQEPTPLACPDDALAEALFTDSYDPADYRWVPVRRRPRLDEWTEEKQRRLNSDTKPGAVNMDLLR